MPPVEEPHPLDLARRRLSLDPATPAGVPPAAAPRPSRRRTRPRAGRRAPWRRSPGALMAVIARDARARRTVRRGLRALLRGERLAAAAAARRRARSSVSAPRGSSTATAGARGSEPRAAAWFAESERRYFTTHFGARGAAALDALAAPRRRHRRLAAAPRGGRRAATVRPRGRRPVAAPGFRVVRVGAARRRRASWRPPADVARASAARRGTRGPWTVRRSRSSGREDFLEREDGLRGAASPLRMRVPQAVPRACAAFQRPRVAIASQRRPQRVALAASAVRVRCSSRGGRAPRARAARHGRGPAGARP